MLQPLSMTLQLESSLWPITITVIITVACCHPVPASTVLQPLPPVYAAVPIAVATAQPWTQPSSGPCPWAVPTPPSLVRFPAQAGKHATPDAGNPIFVTGSRDTSARVWDVVTGEDIMGGSGLGLGVCVWDVF